MGFAEYLETGDYNLAEIRKGLPEFTLFVPHLDDLYDQSLALVPRASDPFFGRALLLCHKDLLSCAMLTGQRHVDDAAMVTRRAIETARTCLACKYDPANFENWRSDEKRSQPWASRRDGKQPKKFWPNIKYPTAHENLEWLGRQLGVLSDAFVDFTPEFLLGQNWKAETQHGGTTVALAYFTVEEAVVRWACVVQAGSMRASSTCSTSATTARSGRTPPGVASATPWSVWARKWRRSYQSWPTTT